MAARFSRADEKMPPVYPPCLCVVAQGRKALMLGDERYVYDRSRFIAASVDLPVTGQVIGASPEQPYLCVMLELDPKVTASLLFDADWPSTSASSIRLPKGSQKRRGGG